MGSRGGEEVEEEDGGGRVGGGGGILKFGRRLGELSGSRRSGSSEYKCSWLPAGPASAYVGNSMMSLRLLMTGAVLCGGEAVGIVRGSGGTGGAGEESASSFDPRESGSE